MCCQRELIIRRNAAASKAKHASFILLVKAGFWSACFMADSQMVAKCLQLTMTSLAIVNGVLEVFARSSGGVLKG